MSVEEFVNRINNNPEGIAFSDTMVLVEKYFDYTPVRFTNGVGDDKTINEAGSNEGSCKIFALGKLLALDEEQTLNCFGDYYRIDVLQHPDGSDHANIRNFMHHGWQGIAFDSEALSIKGV